MRRAWIGLLFLPLAIPVDAQANVLLAQDGGGDISNAAGLAASTAMSAIDFRSRRAVETACDIRLILVLVDLKAEADPELGAIAYEIALEHNGAQFIAYAAKKTCLAEITLQHCSN